MQLQLHIKNKEDLEQRFGDCCWGYPDISDLLWDILDLLCYCQVKLDLCPSGLSCHPSPVAMISGCFFLILKSVYLHLEEQMPSRGTLMCLGWTLMSLVGPWLPGWDPDCLGLLGSTFLGSQMPSGRTQHFSSLNKNKFTFSNTWKRNTDFFFLL